MGTLRTLTDIQHIVIHCADTPNGRAHSAADINQWHGERGFKRDLSLAPNHNPNLKHIGYHYVITLDGRWHSGRPLTETGAHCKGHNHNSIGICLIGRDQYTQAQWQGLHDLILHLRHEIGNELPIRGHCELDPNKTCPGFNVHYWLNQGFKPDVSHVLNAPLTPMPTGKENTMPSWIDSIASIVSPVANVIDELHTSDEEKLKLKHDMLTAQNQLTTQVLSYESQLMDAKSKIIVAEANSQSWLARNWRPITMLTFLGLIVADTFGATEFRLSEQAWDLLQLGIGGYVVGRSAEKIMPNVLKALGK